MPRLRQNILLNVKLENEASMADAPINVKPHGDGGVGQGVGILTFSEKNESNSPPPGQHNLPKVSKAPTLGRVEVAKIISFRPCCTQ